VAHLCPRFSRGDAGRNWIEAHFDQRRTIAQYDQLYRQLI
jgi:hypothetical protein